MPCKFIFFTCTDPMCSPLIGIAFYIDINFVHFHLRRGRPTRNTEKTCYIDSSLPGASSFCDDPARCPGGCKTCDVDDATDPCNGIRETECAYREDGTDDSNTVPSEDGCSFFCSLRGVEYDATYLTFAKRVRKTF